MDTEFTNQPRPTLVNVIAWLTLVSGIVNIIWGLGAMFSLWWTIICIPFLVLPMVLGIFEVIYAAKLLSNPPQAVQPSTTIAILEIICIITGNVFSVVVGILVLVFYNDVAVRDYFARLNGSSTPVAPVVPVVPEAPAPVPAPKPEPVPDIPSAAPVAPEEVTPAEEPEPPAPEPSPEEPPAKPKRPRKVAGK